jgi:hypothetical protein
LKRNAPEAEKSVRVMGIIGVLVFVAGVQLIWQARKEVLYWMREFVQIFRQALMRPEESGVKSTRWETGAHDRRGTLRLVSAIGLIFLGQFLVLLDLAF